MEPEQSPIDLPSRRFQPLLFGLGAWTNHIHFGYDAVAAVRPRLLVELGTERGESYFAFCQSVAENETGTRCFAVDTWLGDQQAGGYDETTFREVSAHNDAHYATFSTLLRCSFDEAWSRFGDESIDLLHLDGLHTEEAVRQDVDAWLPKLRPGGVFLMHDVHVRVRGFGVWKVWAELRTRGRSYTFEDGPGLGVWQKPPFVPLSAPVESLLAGTPEAAATAEYYRVRAQEFQELIRRQWHDGTIRDTAAAKQSIIQLFYTHDGTHREEESVLARIGHDDWNEVTLALPVGAGAAPLRLDFVSPFTTIDIARIEVTHGGEIIFAATDCASFDRIVVAGDAQRQSHPRYLRTLVTGIDPQLLLPSLTLRDRANRVCLRLRLRVSPSAPAL